MKNASKRVRPAHKPSTEVTSVARHAYVVKGKTLQLLDVPSLERAPSERQFKSIKDIEQTLLQFAPFLFGPHVVVIELQKGSTDLFAPDNIPSLFLFEHGPDVAKPRFYLVTIASSRQNSMDILLPRLGKFLGALRNTSIVEKLIERLAANGSVRKALLTKMKASDIPHSLKAALTHATVLLVTDGALRDLPEVMGTFAGSWQSVKVVVFKKFALGKETVFSLTPSFNELLNGQQRSKNAPVSEAIHLESVEPHVKELYQRIKSELLGTNPRLIFNAQRYYISIKNRRNVAIVQFSKRKLSIVVMNEEKDTRKKITKHLIRSLKPSIQKFWSGPCCTVVIENDKHLKEVIDLLKQLVRP